jgi:predicted ester cyclase
MGLPASGKYVTLSLHEFHTFREGRISVTRHMEDWMGLFRQIGALPSAL